MTSTKSQGLLSRNILAQTEEVQKLYDFRDHYFEKYDIGRAKHKTEDMTEKLQQVLKVLEELQDNIENKAEYLMLRGKALNVLPTYSSEAKDLLSKAVKLDPKLVEAWIQLGEVYWKDKHVEDAKNCFIGALNHQDDKVALRNLSMVLRQLGQTSEERVKLIEESVEKARKAVQIDLKDGTSWFILGNAYLSLFFATGQNPVFLKQCMGAYQQAEKDPISVNNPDFHFNKATVLKFQENYQEALQGFAQAGALDPTWEETMARETSILDYLCKVSELIQSKGKIRAKKLTSLVESIKDTDLGPYHGGTYTGPKGETIKLQHVMLADLQPEANPEKVIVGKVICSVVTDEPVPFTFCIVDKTCTCYSVTVYNIAPGTGVKIGDSVAVPDPYVQQVGFSYKQHNFDFRSVRVDSPMVMVVNGRKQTISHQAPSVLTTSVLSA